MKISLIISDADYRKIMATSHRVDGTIGVIDPKTFDFRAFNRTPHPKPSYRELRTRHGWARITNELVKVQFKVRRADNPDPSGIIWDEGDEAAVFVQENQ